MLVKLYIMLLSSVFFLVAPTKKKYILVTGDITCKACVIEIHSHLSKRNKKKNICIALKDKGHLISNETGLSYYRSELPKANFIFLQQESFFPKKEKFPYVLTIVNADTVKIPYDSLYARDILNTALLK